MTRTSFQISQTATDHAMSVHSLGLGHGRLLDVATSSWPHDFGAVEAVTDKQN